MNPSFLTLGSGHRLAYDVYGDPRGIPAFYFHGWPSSRIQGALMHEASLRHGLCIVAMDRPGIGASDFIPGRRLQHWPQTMRELSAHLGWERFHLFGVSGGGPYVLATAHAMPERVLSANDICGAPPLRYFGTSDLFWPYRLVLMLRNWFPRLLSPAFHVASAFSRWPKDRPPLNWLIASLSERDREALSNPETYRIIVESFRECLRSGVPTVQADGDIYMDDWGFDLRDISAHVHLWHGIHDRNIPWSYAKRVAELLPNVTTHWVDNDGHYSLPVLRVEEIVTTALSNAERAAR